MMKRRETKNTRKHQTQVKQSTKNNSNQIAAVEKYSHTNEIPGDRSNASGAKFSKNCVCGSLFCFIVAGLFIPGEC